MPTTSALRGRSRPIAALAVTAAIALGGQDMAPAQGTPAGRPGATGPTAAAQLRDPAGTRVGEARLRQTPHGVLVTLDLEQVAPGEHAVHIHEFGRCTPTFEAAGGHFNPARRQHGLANPQGAHAGDLPNIHVPGSGRLTVEMFARDVTLERGAPNSLLDDDGSALVVHAQPDDHRSDPAGDSGERIACGVITG